jgi:hypothetical protein
LYDYLNRGALYRIGAARRGAENLGVKKIKASFQKEVVKHFCIQG